MNHGDFEQIPDNPKKEQIYSDYRLFMIPKDLARAVLCPNSALVIVDIKELPIAYKDLTTWGLTIHPLMCNQ